MPDNYGLSNIAEDTARVLATPIDIAQEVVGRPIRAGLGYLSGYDIPEPPRISYPYWKSIANTSLNIPKNIATSLAETMGGNPLPNIAQDNNAHDYTRDYTHDLRASIMPGEVTPPISETEQFKKTTREFYSQALQQHKQDMNLYRQQVNIMNKEIKRIADKGKSIGKSSEEILGALKYQSIKQGWDKIKEPKMDLNLQGISELFQDKTGKNLDVERGKLKQDLRLLHPDWTKETIDKEVEWTYPTSQDDSPSLGQFNKRSW